MFAPRLIEIFAGADSATRSWSNILALKAFSLSFRRSHTFGTSGRASRRRCRTEFFGTFALTRLSIFRSVWGYSSSRRLHGRQARTRLGPLTKFAFVFAFLNWCHSRCQRCRGRARSTRASCRRGVSTGCRWRNLLLILGFDFFLKLSVCSCVISDLPALLTLAHHNFCLHCRRL